MHAALILGALALTSCSDNLLDTSPSSNLTEDTFWQTENHAMSAINGVYAAARSPGIHDRLLLGVVSPNAVSSTQITQLQQGQHDPGLGFFTEWWDESYETIGRSNEVLANIGQIEINEALKERIRGEARFLRAFAYHDLVNLYGGVPLILDAANLEAQQDLPRNTREEVIAQVISDLNFASGVLPRSYTDSDDVGRATEGAALALKARVLLYEGRWEEAAAAAQEVMQLNEYSLYPDYRGLFMLANENNQEVIFDIQYKRPEYTNRMDRVLELQYDFSPLPDLVDSYLMTDGRTTENSPLYNPENPYQSRDPRLRQTIVVPGSMFRGQEVPVGKQFTTGYGYKKYTTYRDSVSEPVNDESALNYIVLRYGHVLLTYAEARNEAYGPDKSVYEALNLIRNRVGMPAVPTGLSKQEMREVIRHERRIEMAGEGLYYNDIRRWRTAEEVMDTDVFDVKGEFVQSRSFDSEDYLWPIAQETIQENPALEQNPGY